MKNGLFTMALNAETVDHINLVNWFNHNFPELEEDFHHFAGERKCTPQQGRLLKRMAVKKGVADFHLAFGQKGYFGLWMELKTKSGKVSKEQEAFLERKEKRGYFTYVAWGFEAAQEMILFYLSDYLRNR